MCNFYLHMYSFFGEGGGGWGLGGEGRQLEYQDSYNRKERAKEVCAWGGGGGGGDES